MNRTREFRELSSDNYTIVSIEEEKGPYAVLHKLKHQIKFDLQKLSVAAKHFSPFQDSFDFHKTLFHIDANIKDLGSHIHEIELSISKECSSQAKENRLLVLMSLKEEMATYIDNLYNVLKLRERFEKQQNNRRSQFQRVSSKRRRPKALHTQHLQEIEDPSNEDTNNPAQVQTQVQTQIQIQDIQNSQNNQETQENSDEAYQAHRLSALVEVQKRIEAMSKLYTRFLTLLQTQEEVVLQIDQDITVTLDHVEHGHKELTKLFRSENNSTWLIVKVFATLIMVIVFWVLVL
jgi:hypothetical protein